MLRPVSLKLRGHNLCTHFSFSGDTRLSGCFTDPTTTNQPAAGHVDKLESASACPWHPQGSGQPEISRARIFYPIRREAGRFDTLYEMCLTGRVGSLSWAWAVCPRIDAWRNIFRRSKWFVKGGFQGRWAVHRLAGLRHGCGRQHSHSGAKTV